MRALEVRAELTLVALDSPEGEDTVVADPEEVLGIHERPTIPVPAPPCESGVRLAAVAISLLGATVDMVTADLTRDPRSESWVGALEGSERTYDPEVTPRVAALVVVRALRG